jgi:membrane fusion protein (multidrug efflux system)
LKSTPKKFHVKTLLANTVLFANKKTMPELMLLAGLLLIGCQHSENNSIQVDKASPTNARISVQIMPLNTAQSCEHTLALVGSLKPNQIAHIATNIAGQVMETQIERGQWVRKGSTLIRLDSNTFSWAVNEAEARLASMESAAELATMQCHRQEALYKEKAISQEALDEANQRCKTSEANVKAAQAQLNIAQKNLADAEIKAPFSGQIEERLVNTGEHVQASHKVAILVETSRLKLEFFVPEQYARHIKPESVIRFKVRSLPDQSFPAKIIHISPTVRDTSRDIVVEAEFNNQANQLKPGMFAEIELVLEETHTSTLPSTALRRDDTGARVFVAENGIAREKMVELGNLCQGQWMLLKGLEPGASIISPLTDDIRDGTPIQVQTPLP